MRSVNPRTMRIYGIWSLPRIEGNLAHMMSGGITFMETTSEGRIFRTTVLKPRA
jgi:hypothetical protein